MQYLYIRIDYDAACNPRNSIFFSTYANEGRLASARFSLLGVAKEYEPYYPTSGVVSFD